MNFQEITSRYYSAWIGCDGILAEHTRGVEFVYSAERNTTQYGYGAPIDLYIFIQPERVVVSYGDKIAPKLSELRALVTKPEPADEIRRKLAGLLECTVSHGVKYAFDRLPDAQPSARPLERGDYPLYREFFLRANPSAGNTDWLEEYFDEMTAERLCCASFADGIVVSCTDSPGIPYLRDEVREIGIHTLGEYRGKGHAADACTAALREILLGGLCPLWSTDSANIASQRLAERVGFRKFADVLTASV